MPEATCTTWQSKRARIARLCKDRPSTDPEIQRLRTELRTQRASEYISQILAQAPPLSAEQREQIAALLRSGGAAS